MQMAPQALAIGTLHPFLSLTHLHHPVLAEGQEEAGPHPTPQFIHSFIYLCVREFVP